jgi:hypothetical protein
VCGKDGRGIVVAKDVVHAWVGGCIRGGICHEREERLKGFVMSLLVLVRDMLVVGIVTGL